MPKGIPLTPEEFEERRRMISKAAVDLIVENGFTQTTMRKIAAAVGMGKSTLYDYFTSKDDIVVYVFHEHMSNLIQHANAIIAQEGSAAEHLHLVMKMHLAYLLDNKAFYLRLAFEAQRLNVESQQRIQVDRYAYQDIIKGLIEQGIAEGCFRPVDPTMAMKTVMSMLTPVVYTSRPSGAPEEMLESGLDIILTGLEV
jgi:AcrR family transcriptional regulator